MSNSFTQPCEHEDCKCTVEGGIPGAAYCSDVCEARDTNDEEMEGNCPCGHPPCDGA